VELPEGREMVMPGDNVRVKGALITPIAMEEGLRFAIREGDARWVRRRHQDHRVTGRRLPGELAMRDKVILACNECKQRNYNITNKRKHPDRLEHKKYCRFCRSTPAP